MTTLEAITSIRTYTGKLVNPLNLKLDDISLNDIAHSLSQQCRFAGHTKRFYSVAEHSVNVSKHCKLNPLGGLLHDASEAYLVDLPAPIKHADGFEVYSYYEAAAMDVIREALWYWLPYSHAPLDWSQISQAEIHEADQRMLATEQRDLMNNAVFSAEPYPYSIIGMCPEEAERYFLGNFNELCYNDERI